MSPIVSVIMPTYNNALYIEEAIESVIYQNIDYELLIIDDASTDNTYQIVKPYLSDRIRYIKNKKNQGVAKSRNRGVLLATGVYIAFLDSDDWWKQGKLKTQIKKMEQTNAVLCYTWRELYSEEGISYKKVMKYPTTVTYKKLLRNNVIACSSVVLRNDIAKEFLMEHDEFHEDYLTWIRIVSKYGEAVGINKPYLNSRMTANGKSRNKIKTLKMTYGVYRCLHLNWLLCLYYTGSHVIKSAIRYFI